MGNCCKSTVEFIYIPRMIEQELARNKWQIDIVSGVNTIEDVWERLF
jgi:hypothetical protein